MKYVVIRKMEDTVYSGSLSIGHKQCFLKVTKRPSSGDPGPRPTSAPSTCKPCGDQRLSSPRGLASSCSSFSAQVRRAWVSGLSPASEANPKARLNLLFITQERKMIWEVQLRSKEVGSSSRPVRPSALHRGLHPGLCLLRAGSSSEGRARSLSPSFPLKSLSPSKTRTWEILVKQKHVEKHLPRRAWLTGTIPTVG